MRTVIFIAIFILQSWAYASCPETPPKTPPPGDIIPVNFGVYVVDIHQIENKSETFKADVVLNINWRDERFKKGNKCFYKKNELWTPLVQVFNQTFQRSFLKPTIYVDKNSTVFYQSRFLVTVKSPFQLREFPFDVQTLQIKFVSMGKLSKNVQLIFDKDNSGYNPNLSINGWKLIKAFDSVESFKAIKSHTEKISIVIYNFVLERHTTYYWWKVFLPLTLIIFMSWATFLIDPSQFGPQLSLSTTSILTLIAFLFSLQNILPPLNYLTRLDFYIYTSLLLVFAAFLNAIATSVLVLTDNRKIAENIDYYCIRILPTIYVIIVILFWLT